MEAKEKSKNTGNKKKSKCAETAGKRGSNETIELVTALSKVLNENKLHTLQVGDIIMHKPVHNAEFMQPAIPKTEADLKKEYEETLFWSTTNGVPLG